MGYSRDIERQNNALQTILDGGAPEKRIYVSMEDKDEKKERQKQIKRDREQSNERSEALKAARMPMFCPECDKVMKKRLDDRMWYLYAHCFNCQVKVENKLRLEGKFGEWSHKKVIANKLSWIKDQKEEIKTFRDQKAPEFLQQIRPDGYSVDKEKWGVDISQVRKQADEALDHLQKMEDSLK